MFSSGNQETDVAFSPGGQMEVSIECHAPALLHPPTPHPSLHCLLLHSSDKEPVRLPRKQAFSMAMLEHVGRAGRLCFAPVMKDSPHACLIARLMVPNPTVEPIHYSLIMFNGASDTTILPALSCCAAPTTGTLAIVAQRSWWVQLRPQIVRSNKEGTHATQTATENTPGQINTLTLHARFEKYIRPSTQSFFVLFSYLGSHPPLFGLAQQGEKMADHHGNCVCRSATAVMYVVTLLTLWWTPWAVERPDRPALTVLPLCVPYRFS